MKIKEVLQLTQEQPLADIAKEHLTIGKLKATEALKAAGAYSKNGVRGWFFDGDESILEKSIYDFIATSKQKASSKNQNASNKPVKNNKRATSELDSIDRLLIQNKNNSQQRVYRGFYWDADIIHFIDNVRHGNKSDLMNEIVRKVLIEKGLI